MDAFLMHEFVDQQIPPQKSHIGKNPHRPSVHRPHHGTFDSSIFYSTGILQTPPPFLAHSYSLPQPPPQPPLLPLPAPIHRHRSFSIPTNNRIGNQTRSPNKTKSPKHVPRKPSSAALTTVTLTESSGVGSKGKTGTETIDENRVAVFPGSGMVFVMSPPPSSLPLPSFSLRHSKLGCSAKVASGVDAGASDDLRRLFQLSKPAQSSITRGYKYSK